MQYAARIVLFFLLVASVLGSTYHSGAKLRRDGVLNLYPFPRVGRSGPQTWQVPNDLYLEPEAPMKRQLYAFPRVGRAPHLGHLNLTPLKLEELLLRARAHGFVKRESESTDGTGMWFGPRVGRGFRSEDDEIVQNDNEQSELEQIDPEQAQREKRQIKHT